jgi:Secretion system C-terminal sorting domain
MKHIICIIFFLVFTIKLDAQLNTIEYLDINNVSAGILTHGDMFWNIDTGYSAYEYPKGSGKHCGFASSIWIGGYNHNTGALHVAAQTYRQGGNDYWPGPLDSAGNCTQTESAKWDKIWKVNKSTIDSFLLTPVHTIANTPKSILHWPAIGNVHAKGKFGVALTVDKYMAPFVDVDSNEIYDALLGDFPLIPGEQALYWVFNDNTGIHTQSGAPALKLEFQAMAFACNQAPLKNVTFYNYQIINKSNVQYDSTVIGFHNDLDLGYAFDDHIGVDTNRRLGICYNDSTYDKEYGNQLTQYGVMLLYQPADRNNYKAPLGGFITFDNIQGPTGNPINAFDFNNYMRNKWRDGKPLTLTCNGRDSGQITNVMYPDIPNMVGGLSDEECNPQGYHRRMILNTVPFKLLPNVKNYYSLAVMNTPLGINNGTFMPIQSVADDVLANATGCAFAAVAINKIPVLDDVKIFPNPSNGTINFNNKQDGVFKLEIYSLDGKLQMHKNINSNYETVSLNISILTSGIYFVKLFIKNTYCIKKIIVE